MIFRSATSRNVFSIVALGLATTMTAAGALLYVTYSGIRDASITEMTLAAAQNAAEIESDLRKDYQLVADMEAAISAVRTSGTATRDNVMALMQEFLARAPNLVGVSTGWDPDTFDGKDSEFVNAPAHDASGRFVPYIFRSGGAIQTDVLVDYDKPGAGDYYILPHDTGKPVLLEPYVYPVDGKDVLMTTISVPAKADGKVVGYVGADIDLAEASQQLAEKKPLGDGFIAMLSAAGAVVAHPDSTIVGKSLAESGLDAAAWQKVVATPGDAVALPAKDGTPLLAVAVPIEPFEGASWFAIAAVPEATVFAKLNSLIATAALIIVAGVVVLSVAGWLIARRFVRRIADVVDQTTQIAEGRFDVTLTNVDRTDELGDLSRSLEILLNNSREKLELEKKDEARLEQEELDRQERSKEHRAREADIRFVVDELSAGLSRLANGDMTVRLERPFTANLDSVRTDFNQSIEKLQAAMVSFSENAATIRSGSEEISAAADDLAKRTEQQAASVEETAAALDEITKSIKDSTRRAEDAGELVNRTKDGAERSGEVVRRAVAAMSEIEQSSESISNIIGVIDEIAFQTNLLALNAGVEAARAGEAGKGFAVVAQEVRELAQRSANAAKEIKSLITASGDHVKHGVALVGETGEALEAIVAEVQDINSNVQAIVMAAREQSTSLQEINTAINVMDQGTQRNAAMVEETNAASHTLVQEVSALSNRLAQFNLGLVGASQPAAMPARGAPAAPASPSVAGAQSRPAPSPARALGNKIAAAFTKTAGGNTAEEWQEF
ncbi:methyl-accepting chemotaxis protein [Ciceribacter sp. L1K22]|uniref:methyl-accepting chemotaxis protein n=1 Tax=Ciceribacter sp. L1K22 TaxID=2820275 RepID=UPI001ABDDDF9|nr:methyl-accepting chemotaxis protein [Ciceribacter sp. L1K22]MBO3760950.1 HAMP domain-containing protein [Ciceribacter sp. L1K22]